MEVATKPSLTIVRKYKASPEKVWAALTRPEALRQWMAPSEAFTSKLHEADVRVGGNYRFVMVAPDGEEHDVRGTYREVVPNAKLVYTWAWKSTPERESLVTVTLRPDGAGTQLTLTHEQFFNEEARNHHEQGWNGCLEQLGKFLDRA
jgi:uncharacterized protein YndB with AHSA1/START domain